MANFIGEHTCKLDSKGRVVFPSSLKKQMDDGDDRFVAKKSIFGKSLDLFPMKEWDQMANHIRKNTNQFNREHVKFVREFFKGAAEVTLDGNSRLLLPKRLIDLIEVDSELVMVGQFEKIELWAKNNYDRIGEDEDSFADLAEKILGNTNLSGE